MHLTITCDDLIATLRGRQWTVRDVDGATVAWIVPADRDRWVVSMWGPAGDGEQYASPRAALDAVCAVIAHRA